MAQIIPAILGESYSDVARRFKILEGHTDWVHLDVADGRFVPNISWGSVEDFRFLDGQTKVEVHLMAEKPEDIINDWVKVADRIIVHYEATDHCVEIVETFSSSAAKIGLALLLSTSIEVLEPYLSKINLVQLMSIAEVGAQGHLFNNRVLDKVKHLRALAPDATIQLDGGINFETAKLALTVGVNSLVVGSAIWQSLDPLSSLRSFQSLLQATN